MIENPGTLLVSPEQYLAGGVSECRNKSLQQMFLMIGGGERAGSGADKIRAGWRAQHWRAPRLEIRTEPDRVRLTLPMVSLIPAETLDRLRREFGTRVDALTAAAIEALATADIEGVVSNSRLQELLTDHPVDITRMLQGLCERGFLISDNRRRWTTYRLGGGVTSIPSLFDEAGEERSSSRKPGDLSHKPGDLSHKPGDLSHKPGGELTPKEEETLSNLADRVSRSGRAKPELVRQVILEICAQRYLTADQIARLLHRNIAGLRTRYLYPMTSAGLLRLRYPESPNRPDQAYISVAKQ